MDYPLDLVSPVRHVVTELERAGNTALSLGDLAGSYSHPNSGDVSRVQNKEKVVGEREALQWIIAKAIEELGRYISKNGKGYHLTVPVDSIRYKRRKVHRVQPRERFEDSFDPMRGKFSDNIRDMSRASRDNLDELRDSMKAHGWVEQLPALRDERGVVLVGHRRLQVAGELGIEPVIQTVRLGSGDAADAQRFRIAIASNIASRPLGLADRRRLEEYLHLEAGWSQQAIAEALAVSQSQVQRDLAELPGAGNSARGRGRPRKITPKQEAEIIEGYFEQGKTQEQLAEEVLGKTKQHSAVQTVIAREQGRRERAEADKVTALSVGTHTCTCSVCGRVDTHGE